VEDIITELQQHCLDATLQGVGPKNDRMRDELSQILSQAKAIQTFRLELERKTENILALLFNNMQVLNDQRMAAILTATRQDAIRSQELGKSMKEDSIAMKTIAILTMFFLPGTSYAALLSMPFFSNSDYLKDVGKLWVWIVLTVPSTVVAFLIYLRIMRRAQRKYGLGASNSNSGGDDVEATPLRAKLLTPPAENEKRGSSTPSPSRSRGRSIDFKVPQK
jgi:hypothetical protein